MTCPGAYAGRSEPASALGAACVCRTEYDRDRDRVGVHADSGGLSGRDAAECGQRLCRTAASHRRDDGAGRTVSPDARAGRILEDRVVQELCARGHLAQRGRRGRAGTSTKLHRVGQARRAHGCDRGGAVDRRAHRRRDAAAEIERRCGDGAGRRELRRHGEGRGFGSDGRLRNEHTAGSDTPGPEAFNRSFHAELSRRRSLLRSDPSGRTGADLGIAGCDISVGITDSRLTGS